MGITLLDYSTAAYPTKPNQPQAQAAAAAAGLPSFHQTLLPASTGGDDAALLPPPPATTAPAASSSLPLLSFVIINIKRTCKMMNLKRRYSRAIIEYLNLSTHSFIFLFVYYYYAFIHSSHAFIHSIIIIIITCVLHRAPDYVWLNL
eukprot:GHVU01132834.1.p1 GENE.GHVU01132834.1~~GHVU01132834.1.p1  ORF type:complete len:147 (+),score=15.06 GHVU01132834.1:294-734(+)